MYTAFFMKKFIFASIVAAAACGVVSLLAQTPAPLTPSQTTAPAGGSANPDTAKGGAKGRGRGTPAGPTPHLPDGKVDLSGVWNGGGPVGDLAQGMPVIPCTDPGAVPQAGGNGRGGAKTAPICREAIPLSEAGKKVMATRQ